MKVLKNIFDFYINSSIHVAIAIYAFVKITCLYLNLPNNNILGYFILYSSIFAYSFIKYTPLLWYNFKNIAITLKEIIALNLFCIIVMLYYVFELKIITILSFLPFSILTFLYVIPLFKNKKNNLRDITSLKIIIISIVWTGITVLIPFINSEYSFNSEMIALVIQRFLLIIVLTLPFDIRDFTTDKKHLQTIPQLIGVQRSKKLGYILLLIVMLLEFYIAPTSNFKYPFMIIFFILLLALQRASIKQSKYYSSFWVESIPIIWWILLLVFM